ncbi:MAG: hypothetical protein U9Q98_10925 [Bacteroidota bacterium]|nr:hypothetical protein [Bacteroidota bacterium]
MKTDEVKTDDKTCPAKTDKFQILCKRGQSSSLLVLCRVQPKLYNQQNEKSFNQEFDEFIEKYGFEKYNDQK